MAATSLPYCIGLTGNIATGKSTVGKMLVALGADFVDADRVAHDVMAPGGAAYDAVVAAFGEEMLADDGAIDRRKLGEKVFSEPEALRRLEALVHPPVIDVIERRIQASRAPVIVIEAIKLLESGMAERYDAVWVTTCSEATQVQRLMTSRGLSRDAALVRVRAQPP
jgi:dephospho-CoA kinase